MSADRVRNRSVRPPPTRRRATTTLGISRSIAATLVTLIALPAGLRAQAGDTLYAGRRCDLRLANLRMPQLSELGDTARFAAVLDRSAEEKAPVEDVVLRFGTDGNLKDVNLTGVARSARGEARDAIRAAIRSIGPEPRDFTVHLVRFTATGQMRLLAETATCPGYEIVTPASQATLKQIYNDHPEVHLEGNAVVQFILEANGQVSAAWFKTPPRFANMNAVVMQLFREMRFAPAIVGHAPVASLMEQPFTL